MERLTEWVGEGADRKAIARQDRRDIGDKDCVTRLAAYEDTELTPERVAELAQAEKDGRLAVANVSGRCGSCVHYRRIEGTARGACLKHPYGKDVICDPQKPYWVVGRSRLKCKLYEEAN